MLLRRTSSKPRARQTGALRGGRLMKIAADITKLIGNTPLVRLNR